MASEPNFELYDKNRDKIPSSHEEMLEVGREVVSGLEPDKVITGYNALCEFLDETAEEETVEVDAEWADGETQVVEVNKYYWVEVGAENAPERDICSVCDATAKTNSDERLESLKSMHHIGTGH